MVSAAEQHDDLLKAAVGLSAGEFPIQAKYNPKFFEVEKDRDARLRDCSMVDTPSEPRFDDITKLMSDVFQTPVSLITLIIDDRVWFKARTGPFGACVARDGSWCNYIVVPTTPEVLITEDASKDARFSHNPYVAGSPYVKFYAGAPLVGTGGRRYGTLCVCDVKERAFTAEMYHLLINFAELAVQELERDSSLLGDWKKDAQEDVDSNRKLRACLSTATEGVGLVDIRAANWKFKYANEAFGNTFGEKVADYVGQGLWDKFETLRLTPLEVAKRIANGASLTLTAIHKETGQKVTLNVQPASTDQISPGKPVGVPSWVPSEMLEDSLIGLDMEPVKVKEHMELGMCSNVAKCFYFVVISPYSPSSGASSERNSMNSSMRSSGEYTMDDMSSNGISTNSGMSSKSSWKPLSSSGNSYGDYVVPEDLAGLELGPLIGSGGFGKVYRGVFEEMVVAVKVTESSTEKAIQAAESESAISRELNHPNLVKTVRTTSWKKDIQVMTDGKNVKQAETLVMWMLQEFCDRGTLIDAVERGWLSHFRSIMSKPNMASMYMTLKEICDGMAHLHSMNIIHCDLNGRNVMLKFSPNDKRMFTAKICDFGLAHMCYGEISASMFGTISHMPPELLMDGRLTFASDVWAFGVLMWEMFTGQRAYQGKQAGNIIFLVTSGKGLLKLPEEAPGVYQEIFNMCQQTNPEDRPTFEQLSDMFATALADIEEEK